MYSHDKEDFIKLFSKFTKIPETKLNTYLENNSINSMIQHPESLKATNNQLEKIKELIELSKLHQRLCRYREYVFKNTWDIVEYLDSKYLSKYDKEQFLVAYLDKGNKLLSCETISIGTVNSSIVHPRDVLKQALRFNSDRMILSHNHPSGVPEPSHEDINITKRLEESSEILGIKVLDHVIIGRNDYYSFKENHLMKENNFDMVDTKNNINKKIYKEDVQRIANLISKFTKIPKIKLYNMLKDIDFRDFLNDTDSFMLTKEQLDKVNDLRCLSRNYKDISCRKFEHKVKGPDIIASYFKSKYSHLKDTNYTAVAFLDTKNKIIESALIPPDLNKAKYIIEKAILYDSSSFILSTNSSKELTSVEMTKEISDLIYKTDIVGIRLLDSIVTDKNKYFSLKEEDILEQQGNYELSKDNRVNKRNSSITRKSLNQLVGEVKDINENSLKATNVQNKIKFYER